MDDTINQFIEIRRVLANPKTKINESSQLETIRISLIDGYRPWHKGRNDLMIEGNMTVIILNDKKRDEDPEKKGVRTMLIHEDYDKFQYRMTLKVGVKLLIDEPDRNIQGEQGVKEIHLPTHP